MSLTHPGAASDCSHCGGLGLQVVPSGRFLSAVTCSCVDSPCPACRDTWFVPVDDGPRGAVRRCDCQQVAGRARLFDAAQLPGRYADATFASFQGRGGAEAALMMTRKLVDEWRRGEPQRGLVLYGKVGRGKTHLVVAAARELLLRHGVSVRFVEFSHLLGDLKMSFDRGGTADLLEPLSQVELLVIDELGKGRNTEFEGTVLDELVSRRYNAGAAILGTTNYEPAAATGRAVANPADRRAAQPTLGDRVSDRVYSRLREMCDFLPVVGDDHREASRGRARR